MAMCQCSARDLGGLAGGLRRRAAGAVLRALVGLFLAVGSRCVGGLRVKQVGLPWRVLTLTPRGEQFGGALGTVEGTLRR